MFNSLKRTSIILIWSYHSKIAVQADIKFLHEEPAVPEDVEPSVQKNVEPAVSENVEPAVKETPVEKTYEDVFMEEVQNLPPVREQRKPSRFCDEDCLLVDLGINEPKTVQEALEW